MTRGYRKHRISTETFLSCVDIKVIAPTSGNEFASTIDVFFFQVSVVVKIGRDDQQIIEIHVFVAWFLLERKACIWKLVTLLK